MTVWMQLDSTFHPEGLGFLTDIVLASDKRPVKEQLEDRYRHGGGFRPIHGFKMKPNKILVFPGDPPFKPSAGAVINDEIVVFYRNCSLLAIIQKDGSFEVTRVD
jgi:hypothetical protein